MVAEAGQEELEALRFDDRLAGGIVDDEMREIGLAGHRAERGEFGRGEADEIQLARARIGHIVEDGDPGRGRQVARAAEMFGREARMAGITPGFGLVRRAAAVIRRCLAMAGPDSSDPRAGQDTQTTRTSLLAGPADA